MRVCLVSHEYPPETGWGGVGTQTHLKAHGLSARGHEVHVVSATWGGAAKTDRDGGATVYRIPAPALPALGYHGPVYWLAYVAAVAHELQRLTDGIAFDII